MFVCFGETPPSEFSSLIKSAYQKQALLMEFMFVSQPDNTNEPNLYKKFYMDAFSQV